LRLRIILLKTKFRFEKRKRNILYFYMRNKIPYKAIRDIRFWIFLFFIIRLIGITNPPLEVAHNWRQTTVTMVSRNFFETDNSIFFPRVDFAGEKTGITGMEFPLLNYMIYLLAKLFGYDHWYGRLINLIVSSFGLWFFFKLTQKYFNNKIAFYSTLVLAVSIWFQYSRKIMPDTFSMSFLTASLYYGSNYLDNMRSSIWNLILYGLFMMLGILSKLPSGYLLIIFLLFYTSKKTPLKPKLYFALITIIGIIPIIVWYFFWVPYLVKTYEFWHFFMGKGFEKGIEEILQNIPLTLSRFYDTALKFIGFAVFVFGLVYAVIKREKLLLSVFSLALLSFIAVILKAGFTFPHHVYYIIPFVPVMALVAGYGLSQIRVKKIALIILIAIVIEGIANQYHDFFLKEKDLSIVHLESDLDSISSKTDLICINSGENPSPMYFAHRKGWLVSNSDLKKSNKMDDLVQKGLKYIVVLKKQFGSPIILERYQLIFENENYYFYDALSFLSSP
jgi:4-amino-4-deoxy-L-arabinose transferase-like glycosyltransferase